MTSNEQKIFDVKPLTEEEKAQIVKIMESYGYEIDDNYTEINTYSR